jgi:hypothetical protein
VSRVSTGRVADRFNHLDIGDQQTLLNIRRCRPHGRVPKLSKVPFDAQFDDGQRAETFEKPLPVGLAGITVT